MPRDLFVLTDCEDPSRALVTSFTDPTPVGSPIITRSDDSKWRFHWLKRNPLPVTGRPFVYLSSRPATVKVAAGLIDEEPDAGTFTITDPSAGETTAAIAYDAPASGVADSVQTLIRASLTTNFSAAVVAGDDGGPWTVARGATGAFTTDITASSAGLEPSGSTVNIVNTQQGTSLLQEKWQVRLRKSLPFLQTSFDAFDSATVTPTVVQAGSASANKTYSVVWNADAYEGGVILSVLANAVTETVGPIACNATSAEMQAAIEQHSEIDSGEVSVTQNGPGFYLVTFLGATLGNSNSPTIAASSDTLKVPLGDQADIAVATDLADAILGTATSATVTFEIEIREDSGKPRTVCQLADATLKADLITNTPGQSTGTDNFITETDLTNGTLTLLLANGDLATPAISLDGAGWGFYFDGSDDMMIVCDGGEVASFSTGGLKMQSTSIWLAAGNATTPALNFGQSNSDTNTGLYWVAADQIGISTGGTLRGTWSSAGLALASNMALSFAGTGAATTINNLGGTGGVFNASVGGTGSSAYGNRAIARTPTSGSTQSISDNTITKITVLTNEITDVGSLWNAASSETGTLAAGVYFFTLTLVADMVDWELMVYNDGALDLDHGKSPAQQPNWSGYIIADGTSIYDFRVKQVSGGSANIYQDATWAGLFLFRLL